MHFLKRISATRERFKIVYPQYWLDKLTNEIMAANKNTGQNLVYGNILAVLKDPLLEEQVVIPGLGLIHNVSFILGLKNTIYKKAIPGFNIVTNDGDIYYAQLAMGDSLTDDFQAAGAGLRLGSDNTTPVKTDTDVGTFLSGSDHAIAATYPKSNDADADNTGSGTNVMTWTYSYLTSEGNVSSIIEGGISDVRAGPSTALLTHFLFGSVFSKTSSDTLKVIVNHSVVGV